MKPEEAIGRILEHQAIHSRKEPFTPYLDEAFRMAIEALKEKRQYEECIEDVRAMICKVNDHYGYTDSMHMFKVLFDQKYHGWV